MACILRVSNPMEMDKVELRFHAEKEVMRMLTVEKYASGTDLRMESRVR